MDSKIILRQSSIIINNYELGDSFRLESFFTLWDDIRHQAYFKGIEYNEETKQLIIPRGVDVPMLENIFSTFAKIDYNVDKYDIIEPNMARFAPRDDIQKKTIAFCYGVKDYAYTKGKSQLSINLNTGKGKTYCSIMTMLLYKMRSMIIMNSESWINQWRDNILEYTDAKPDEIYIIQGSGSIQRLLNRDISQYKYILATHATLRSYGDKNSWDKITELFKYLKIGLKFYDEAHLNFDNICKIDYYTNTYKTFYVTATPARSDSDENTIYKYYFKNIPSIDLFDEEVDPHTDYIAIKYNSKPTAIDIQNCRTRKGFSSNAYAGYVITRPNFFKLLTIIIEIALKHRRKSVFYIATIDSIDYIAKYIEENYPELRGDIGKFHSKLPVGQKDQQLKKRLILSTTKSLGPAVDIKGLKLVVVLAEPFKSEVTARQSLGRTRDDNTTYIEIVDTGFRSIKEYYKYKKPVYKKYAKSYSEIDLDEITLYNKANQIENTRMNYICPAFIDDKYYHGCMITPAYIIPAKITI